MEDGSDDDEDGFLRHMIGMRGGMRGGMGGGMRGGMRGGMGGGMRGGNPFTRGDRFP